MRIGLTGPHGQVGKALQRSLASSDELVPLPRALLDLEDLDAMPSVLDRIAPDILINAAAYTDVEKAEIEPERARLVNAAAPGAMARWAARNDVPFIHFSTDYIFDGSGTAPWAEEDTVRPLSAYGASKLAGEEEVRSPSGSSLIIRTSWVYAAEGNNFLRKIAARARDEAELRVVADQVGAPTSARLIAEGVANMLAGGIDTFRIAAATASGTVHLCASGEASWHQFAEAIIEGLHARGVELNVRHILPICTQDHSTKAKRPLNSRLALNRLQTVFGFTPPHWREALAPELDALALRTTSQ